MIAHDEDPATPTLGELAGLVEAAHLELTTARDAAREANHRVRIAGDRLQRLIEQYEARAKAPLS